MLDKKISKLPELLSPSITGVTVIVQDGVTYGSTLDTIKTLFINVSTNGTSGTSGTNGSSGESGSAGTSGTSGGSGSSGESGSSGTSGSSGSSGTSGSSGSSGTSVSVSGTDGNMVKFTSPTTIGNSLISETGTTVNINASVVIVPLTGTTSRMVEVTSGGTLSSSSTIITGKLTDTATIIKLIDTSNWGSTTGLYVGSSISGTYESQYYCNDDYFFFCYSDNDWIRMVRG